MRNGATTTQSFVMTVVLTLGIVLGILSILVSIGSPLHLMLQSAP